MNEIKVKVTNDNVIMGGKTCNCDCLVVKNGDKNLQICFNQKDNIAQYIGSEVIVVANGDSYSIKRANVVTEKKNK